MTYDALLELVQNRRSTRLFKSDPVPEEYIGKIVEVARWAPSGFNLQPWEFVVVTDDKLRSSIVKYCRDSSANFAQMEEAREEWQGRMSKWPDTMPGSGTGDFSVAPVYILLFGDPRTNIGLPMYRRCDEALKMAAFNGGLANAFLYMHLAAASLGLGSQWVSAVDMPYAQCMIKNLLKIPLDFIIYDMMALGYPAAPAGKRVVRAGQEAMHRNVNPDSYRTDEQVRDFIKKIRGQH